jgi:7-carboxy-7-deazaguanine synthase
MAKIKVSELFYSIQGEGRYQGVPSVFLRTFGCNFRCRGFNRKASDMPKDEVYNPEVKKVIDIIDNYKSYNELPLVATGCDSYAAVYPEFKNLSPNYSAEELAAGIVDLLPYKSWRDEHLVITGGEPLLGWQRSYPELLEQPAMSSLKELTFETNGTQALTDEFARWIKTHWLEHRGYHSLTFSVSPKLSVSGEKWEDAIKPDVVQQLSEYGHTYLKFVVATESDAAEALEATDQYRKSGFSGHVYLMPVGGVENVYSLNNRRVAELALKYGLRYSDRLQVILFKNAWGT